MLIRARRISVVAALAVFALLLALGPLGDVAHAGSRQAGQGDEAVDPEAQATAEEAQRPVPAPEPDEETDGEATDDEATDDEAADGDGEQKAGKATPPAPAAEGDEAAEAAPSLDADLELEALINEASQDSSLGGWEDREAERALTFPRLEHHGYFRFRADVFWNGHLGTVIPGDSSSGTSGIPAPLSLNDRNTDDGDQDGAFASSIPKDAKTLAGANVRFRYQPTFHISPSMRIKATFDVLDNLVLGSTPDFSPNLSRPDVPLVAFAGSAAPPSAGINGFADGIRVKEAYAEWQPAFLIRAGRMASDWGLGILANGGSGIDDDYGDYADRVLLALKLYGVYVVTAYDFVFSGAISADPNEFFGQPKDLGTEDDVKQFVVSVFQKPLSAAEKAQREIDLREEFKPMFDWGVYFVGRFQELDLTSSGYTDYMEDGLNDYQRIALMPRDAWAVVPDIWLKFEKRFDYFSGIRVELEMAGIFGEIGRAVEDTGDTTPGRTIQQMGAALEIEYDRKELTFGLDTGIASGDSAEGFGILDNATIGEGSNPNRRVTNFKFDRNYHVDLLLFREVIGAVTNAWYIKPYFAYDLFDSVEDALGARLDLIYGHALSPKATPGDGGSLGFEADLRLFYEEKGRFNFDIETGVMIPFDAFNYVDASGNTTKPEVAVSVQTRLTLQF